METEHEHQGQPSDASEELAHEIPKVAAEWALTKGPRFDGGDGIRRNTTAADLFSLIFEAPNYVHSDDFLEKVMLNLADDAALIGCGVLHGDNMLSDVIARVALRMEYRVRVALEVDHRMREAELAAEDGGEAMAEHANGGGHANGSAGP